jgi:hypothetical protein
MSTLYLDSVGLAAGVRFALTAISRRDQDLARRLRRASDQVPEHLAEGMCLTGRERRIEYRAAVDATREAIACLQAAESVGALAEEDRPLRQRMEHFLSRLASSMQNQNVAVLDS